MVVKVEVRAYRNVEMKSWTKLCGSYGLRNLTYRRRQLHLNSVFEWWEPPAEASTAVHCIGRQFQ
jgi:hypothetical protein